MKSHLLKRPCIILTTLAASSVIPAQADDVLGSCSELSYARRERAARVLTIATTVEPQETAKALRLARESIRGESYSTINPAERSFLQHTLKEGVARGLACAAGGAAASYAIIKTVLLVIPLVPSKAMTRAAMSAVSFGAAAFELAAFPDITTIELLLMSNSELGHKARRRIEEYNPHLLLLETVDRQVQPTANIARHEEVVDYSEPRASPPELFDQDIHFQ